MKIQAINQYQKNSYAKANVIKNKSNPQEIQNNIIQPTFKGWGGGVLGFMTGGAAGLALTAATLTTPVGWIAAAALYAGTAAGAATGAAIGNKLGDIVNPDDDDNKKNKNP